MSKRTIQYRETLKQLYQFLTKSSIEALQSQFATYNIFVVTSYILRRKQRTVEFSLIIHNCISFFVAV